MCINKRPCASESQFGEACSLYSELVDADSLNYKHYTAGGSCCQIIQDLKIVCCLVSAALTLGLDYSHLASLNPFFLTG